MAPRRYFRHFLGMPNNYALNALITKRAELMRELERHQAAAREIQINLDHVDGAIGLFDRSVDPDTIRAKPLPPFQEADKGQVSRIILGTLRTAERPCSTKELTLHVMSERGMDTADAPLVSLMSARVGSTLRSLRERKIVFSTKEPGQYVRWRLQA
jgi:hypothetical protein